MAAQTRPLAMPSRVASVALAARAASSSAVRSSGATPASAVKRGKSGPAAARAASTAARAPDSSLASKAAWASNKAERAACAANAGDSPPGADCAAAGKVVAVEAKIRISQIAARSQIITVSMLLVAELRLVVQIDAKQGGRLGKLPGQGDGPALQFGAELVRLLRREA